MTRLFHHRLTLGELCGILLIAVAAFYCFWFGTWPMAVLGGLLVMADACSIDRAIHTDYVLTDTELRVIHGRMRLGRGSSPIPLQSITAIRRMPRRLLVGSYVMVEHTDNNISVFTPENETSFAEALAKRVKLAKQHD